MEILYHTKVQYEGKPQKEIDKKIRKEMKELGYTNYASGYNFESGWRDLCFDKVKKALEGL